MSKGVEQQMIDKHGSVAAALQHGIKLSMSMPEIAAEYGCGRSFIRQLAVRNGLVIPSKPRSEIMAAVMAKRAKTPKPPTAKKPRPSRAKKGKEDVAGLTSQKDRKAMTTASLHGEALSREIIMAQVVTIKPGDKDFNAVAADIFRQRELCRRIDPETVERMI